MIVKYFLLQVLVLFIGLAGATAQSISETKQQFTSLGDFSLENGEKIMDCRIGYRTFGKLNTEKSNAVIFLCGLSSTSAELQMFVPGLFVDTTKFYLIIIDALGNGVSSSPSNSTKQPRLQFPQFTISDMVETQYKLLTDKLGIHHLIAVEEPSMGSMQTFQWAVSYPDFMDKVLPLIASPQPTSWELLWANTMLQAIQTDTAYHNGNYVGKPSLALASHISQMVFTSPQFIASNVSRNSFYAWYKAAEKKVEIDWNDKVRQYQAVIGFDIAKNTHGSLEEAAKAIKAKMLLVTSRSDHALNPLLAKKFALMANAQYIEMDSDAGHVPPFQAWPIATIREFIEK